VKAVPELHPVFSAQLLTYVRCARKPGGLLLNFGARHLRDGIRRIIDTSKRHP